MATVGRHTSAENIKKIQLNGDEHILDLGGGPGRYLEAFCDLHPQVRVTLFDQPDTIRYAKKLLAGHRGFTRMSFKKGDLFNSSYGKDYDVIFISNVIHIYPADDILQILKKCHECA